MPSVVFNKKGEQLAEFRTWKNTICPDAQDQLSALFNFNVPQRWSVSHIYQALLNGEKEVKDICFATTLAIRTPKTMTLRWLLNSTKSLKTKLIGEF